MSNPKKPPVRNCEECRHFYPNPLTKHAHCNRGQKLYFTFPKYPGFQDPKSWGYRRSCRLFQEHQTIAKP